MIAGDRRCQAELVGAFREINLGEWEGRTFQEVRERYPEEYRQRGQDIANYRTPGGESFADVQSRVLPAFKEAVEKTKGDCVFVAHAGVNRVILCHLMQQPLEELFSIPQDHAAVNVLRRHGGGHSYGVAAVNLDPGSFMSRADMTGRS